MRLGKQVSDDTTEPADASDEVMFYHEEVETILEPDENVEQS